MIVRCLCQHEAQDKIHGSQNRVANQTKDPSKVRCTCCGILIIVNNKEKDKK